MFAAFFLISVLTAPTASPPTTQPADRPTPEWLADPAAWAGFGEADAEFVADKAPEHVARWRQYRALAMTPVTDDGSFHGELAEALQREAVFVPDVPSQDLELRDAVPTTPPIAPDGPMNEAMFESLASAVLDALIVLQDRPFEEQQARYFAGRVARLDYPEGDAATIEEKLGERVDVTQLDEAHIWEYLRRLYDQRRAAFGGDFNVGAAALDGPRGIACQVFYRSPGKDYTDGILMARGNASGTGWDDYWRAGLLVCARQFTRPPMSQEALIERDGRVLRADVQLVLEMENGERAPMVMTLAYDPRERRWWVNSCCFASSPFIAVVGQAR